MCGSWQPFTNSVYKLVIRRYISIDFLEIIIIIIDFVLCLLFWTDLNDIAIKRYCFCLYARSKEYSLISFTAFITWFIQYWNLSNRFLFAEVNTSKNVLSGKAFDYEMQIKF